jgi:hypothetical protein
MTYREAFEIGLKERITGGGAVDEMVALVNAYQGADRATRDSLFQDWLREARPQCDRCRSPFQPRADRVAEDDDILCDWCIHGYLGATWNPVRQFRS